MIRRPIPTLITLAVFIAGPILAGAGSFADTKAFQQEQKGQLNVHFGTHAKMVATPKGTDCDWVFVDPAFSLDDLKEQGVALTVAEFAAHQGMSNDIASLTQNPIVDTLRQCLGSQGIRVRVPAGVPAQNGTPMAQMAAMAKTMNGSTPGQTPNKQMGLAFMLKANPAALDQMVAQQMAADTAGNQIEKDRYEEDKAKLGVEESAKRAQARQDGRKAEIRAQLLGERPAAPADVSKPATPTPELPPEQRPGYQLVVYVLADHGTNGALAMTGIQNNSTTAEFLLLKDGKPVLAGRNRSVKVTMIGSGNGSGQKCGTALSTAFLARSGN